MLEVYAIAEVSTRFRRTTTDEQSARRVLSVPAGHGPRRVRGNKLVTFQHVRYGVVANIIASHAIARGSIPRVGIFLILPPGQRSRIPSEMLRYDVQALSSTEAPLSLPDLFNEIVIEVSLTLIPSYSAERILSPTSPKGNNPARKARSN